jgi:hypothetical protein
VIYPLPEKEMGVTWPAGGLTTPVAVANPIAPLNIPVPLRIVKSLENVGKPMALGAPNSTELVPVNRKLV